MNNKIRKLQLGDYFLWNNLSREDKVKRNKQIAKLYLDKGPSILNYYNALKAYFGGFNPKNPYLLTGEPTILPGMGSSVANVVAKEYLLNSGLKAIKSTDYLIKGIQGTFPKANLSNILNKYNNEILNNGILSEFKNTGRFKNIMNEILLEIEKVYGKLGSDAFNIIKTNPEGLPYRLGLEWILKYNFKKGGSLKSANARKWKHKKGGKAFVEGVNVLDSNPDAYKYVKKKYKMRSAAGGSKVDWGGVANTIGGLSNSIMNIAKTFKNQKAIDLMKEANASMLNAYKNQAINNAYNDALNSESDKSDIVNRFNAYHKAANSASQIVALKLRELDLQVAQAEQANAAVQNEAWMGAVKNLGGFAMNALNKNGMTLKAIANTSSNDSMFSKNTNVGGIDYKTFNAPTYKTFNDWADANVHNKIGTVDSNGFMNLQLGKTDMNGMLLKLNPIKTDLFNYKLNI